MLRVSPRQALYKFATAGLAIFALVFSAVTPVQAASFGKASGLAVSSTEGATTVSWKKASSNPPVLFRVKATPAGGQAIYPCPNQPAKKGGRLQSSFKCVFAGTDGVSKYTISIEGLDKNLRVVNTSSSKSATPIPTKTLTLTGSISGELTKPGSTELCEEWAIKGANSEISNACTLQVYAITDSGLVFASQASAETGSEKTFTVKVRTTNSKRANVSLELARGDGAYIGPVLLTASGRISLNGQSYTRNKKAPADKTVDLKSFALHTRDNQTAFMTAATAPASSMLRANTAQMVTVASGSDVTSVPVGAGKAGFVSTAKANAAAWNEVLNYGISAKLKTDKSIFSPRRAAVSERVDISIGDNGEVRATIASIAAIDCANFFEAGAKTTLATCWDAVTSFATALSVSSQTLNAFALACATYKADPELAALATSSYIYSLPTDNACRVALLAVNAEVNNAIYNSDFNGGNDCGLFTMNARLALADCYEWMLQQLTNQNPTLIYPFTVACGVYREQRTKKDSRGNDVLINFKLLTTSKTDACGLFLRINADSAGGQQINVAIPPKCKTSFGLLNDPAGTLSELCYQDLLRLDAARGTKDIQTTCPVVLKNLQKALWGDPVVGIGYDRAFNCLMLLQNMGAGGVNQKAANCEAAAPGLDSDLDSIPNALDVDDDGDLVIDTADASGGSQSCSIEPYKSVRTTIDNPLNYGLIDAKALKFDSNKGSATYGYLTSPGEYSIDDLNASINYFLSGDNFGIAYYTYKNEFYPNAKVDNQNTLPAVWITCPGVVWCDPETSRATIGTGTGMQNTYFTVTSATYDDTTSTITYQSANDLSVGSQVRISNLTEGSGSVAFNYSNANVIAANSTSFTISAPEHYCRYNSDGTNAIAYDSSPCQDSTQTITPSYSGNQSASVMSGKVGTAVIANPDFAPGFNKTSFNFPVNKPWSDKLTERENQWLDPDVSACAAPTEEAYQSALASKAAADDNLAAATPQTQEWWDAYHAVETANRVVMNSKMTRMFRSPCWSELTSPIVFNGTTNQNGECQAVNYNPNYSTSEAIPARANFLWQTRCLQADPTSGLMDRIVQGAFISPNINKLEVNTDDDPTNDLSAKDALSATDVLTLNYIAADGTVASVATTIGAYPITAPLIRSFNGHEVDYGKVSETSAANRPLGSMQLAGCSALMANDCGPHSVVVNPAVPGEDKLSIEFDRPQREAFPGETSASGYHDVYGLSYGIELELSSHSGCGANFAARRGGELPIATTAYSNFSNQFTANISTDSGASYLAPLKDKIVDDPTFEPADPTKRLSFTLDIVKCLRDRAGHIKSKGQNIADLQLPYGARSDGLASGWMPVGVGNGNQNCIGVGLSARGEGKTGGTDTALQQFCLQLAPGALTDWTIDSQGVATFTPETVHLGNYLTPQIMQVNQGVVNGSLTATVSVTNYQVFDTACTWNVKLVDTETQDELTVDNSLQTYLGQFAFSGLTSAQTYQVKIEVTDCVAWATLKNDATSSNATFTAGQDGNGGGGNGGGGCTENCGGPQDTTPNFGYTTNWIPDISFMTYVYNYDTTKYDFEFELVNAADMSHVSGVTITPQAEQDQNGNPTGMWFLRISGVPAEPPANYKVKMGFKLLADESFTYKATNELTYPFPGGTQCQATGSSSCPQPN